MTVTKTSKVKTQAQAELERRATEAQAQVDAARRVAIDRLIGQAQRGIETCRQVGNHAKGMYDTLNVMALPTNTVALTSRGRVLTDLLGLILEATEHETEILQWLDQATTAA